MSNIGPINLVIVEDSELVRMGLRTLLRPHRAIRVVGEASTVAQSIAVIRSSAPDVVLMDIRLPDGSGFAACREALAFSPNIKVIFLTSVVDDRLVFEAISAGGKGYLLKEINVGSLVEAISNVAEGKSILDPEVTARVMKMVAREASRSDELSCLSPQEKRVLELVALGKTNKEVGSELSLSEKTVKNYLANVFDKLNVTRRSQAVALFVQKSPPRT